RAVTRPATGLDSRPIRHPAGGSMQNRPSTGWGMRGRQAAVARRTEAWYHPGVCRHLVRCALFDVKEEGRMSAQSGRPARWRAVGSILAATAIVVSGLTLRPSTAVRAAGGTLLVARDITDGKTMDPGWSYEFTAGVME